MPLVWQNDTLRMYYIHSVLYGIICIATALVADAIPSLLAHAYLASFGLQRRRQFSPHLERHEVSPEL